MSIYAGPEIVTTSLALCVDAANPRSFSPNVIPNPTDIFAWCGTGGVNNCTIARDTAPTPGVSPAGGTALRMNVTGNDPFTGTYNSAIWNLAPAVIGQTWTVSVWVAASVATTGELFIFEANSSGGLLQAPSGAINITTSWTRVSFTTTFTNAATAFVQIRLDGPNSGGTGQTIWWDGLQVERSSSATTFNSFPNINGTNWRDVSGQNRNGTMVNFPSFNTANSGFISLNGVNAYVSTGLVLPSPSTIPTTFEIAFKNNDPSASFEGLIGASSDLASGFSIGFFGGQSTIGLTYNTSGQRFENSWTYDNSTITIGTFVFNGRNISAYRNGSFISTFTAGFDATANANGIQIGRNLQGGWGVSQVDIYYVRVYSGALSANEVNFNFQATRGRFGL